MITIRPNSRTAQFALSFAFLACSAQAERENDPNPSPRGGGTSQTGGVVGAGGTVSTGGTFVAPTGGTVGTPTGGMGGSKAGAAGAGGTPTAKGGTVGAGGTTGGTPGVIVQGGGGTVAAGGTGGGGTVVSCDMPWAVSNDGYVKAKGAGTTCMHGYAFASASPAATSKAMPTSFASCGANCMLCFSGEVGASNTDVALMGFNVNQSPGSQTKALMKPTGKSLTVGFSKIGTFPLRVQLQAKNAEGSRWCYTVTEPSPVTIPYASFNTECWEGGAGKAYANEEIEAVMLLIPGSVDATAATPYEACLTTVTEN